MPDPKKILEVAGRKVPVSNPDKIFFPRTGHTKLDLVRYYLSVADGALGGVAGRPMVLKRFVHGAESEAFFQKRAPSSRPDWIETTMLSFPSGRTAEEVVVRDAAGLAWVVNLGCIDLNPHPVRAEDLDHPDELRVDLDPVPGVDWPQIVRVALVARDVLSDFGLTGWPKTSGSRGIHVYARIEPRWTFPEVRSAAVALAREIERRAPADATSRWWKEERHGVFVDYNQNAKDRTVASAYSVRPTVDARVSTPLSWDEVPDCDPAAFTIDAVPARFADLGDLWAGIDAATGSLEPLLAAAARDEAAGLPDAPWPPHFTKQAGEQPRVQPSKRRSHPAGHDQAPPQSAAPQSAAPQSAAPQSAAPQSAALRSAPLRSAAQRSAPGRGSGTGGRRKSAMPLIEIARAATKAEAMQGLERWQARHPEAAAWLEPADVLVDSMRGRFSTWTRIRLNLRNVPAAERPQQEPLEVDYDPWTGTS
jgi:bifunctional non-homologous end joining protein LigD